MNSGSEKGACILRRLLQFVSVLTLWMVSISANAQEYPNKIIRIIVPFAAGGPIDFTARLVAQRLEQELRQSVIIENRIGAAGKIGAEAVARADSDGYTILYTAGPDLTILQNRPSTSEGIRNLTPITAGVAPVVAVATRPGLGIDSMEQLLAYAKTNPGKLTYGSLGYGSAQHLMGEYFKQEGYEMLQVPFNGMIPIMEAVAGAQIDVAFSNLATSLPLASDGRVKILAVAQSESFVGAPEIPPITKAMPKYPFPQPYFAYYGPPNLPRPIVSKLSSEIGRVLLMPEIKAKLNTLGIVPVITTPEQFAAMVQDTSKEQQKIITAAGIKLD
jgi:tripartite-type tricarboxylate transporter receptor subunit TctC